MRNNYFLTKAISSLLVLIIVMSSTFILLRTLPGGPFDTEKKLPPRIKANIEKKYTFENLIKALEEFYTVESSDVIERHIFKTLQQIDG